MSERETTEQFIRSVIDETREMVAALPQKLFDLRKENRRLRTIEAAAKKVHESAVQGVFAGGIYYRLPANVLVNLHKALIQPH